MDPAAQLPPEDVVSAATERPRRRYTRAILTSSASALVPGIGQIAQGRTGRGVIWLGGFAALVTLILLLRVDSTYIGFILSLFALVGLSIASGCDSLWYWRNRNERKPTAFLIVLPIVLGFLFGACGWQLLLLASGFRPFDIPSTGMSPSIEAGDRIITDSRAYVGKNPEHGDVIVFKRAGTTYLKRVIGLPGETLSISDGVVAVNGKPINETYIALKEGQAAYGRDFPTTRVPAGRYFVLGDNRDVSLDSRDADFGMVNRDEVTGKALYVWDSRRVGRRADLLRPTPVPGGPNS
jgi:signal peptidase I